MTNLEYSSRCSLTKKRHRRVLYRGCQKTVPIEDLLSATTPYAAILFSEHYYDKRYKFVKQIYFEEKNGISQKQPAL